MPPRNYLGKENINLVLVCSFLLYRWKSIYYILEDIGLTSYLHSGGGDTLCELCGDSFPHPVTYHMHQEHQGCGQHAGGKGYNSGGNYCLGWAGNCGDGGVRK